ncbi:hypothetical protein F5X99DRAFT_406701 [Biscogniauxia marginata]|nr:hypothetical protein F5X99DRAFT_406701 [Biscogniauxia marginata]
MDEQRAIHTERPSISVVELLLQYPIRQSLFSNLDIKDILRLSQASFNLRQATRLNVNSRLGSFFNDPLAFRSQLGRCDALVTGDFVLHFLSGISWSNSELTIVVQQGKNSEDMSKFLKREEYLVTAQEPSSQNWMRKDDREPGRHYKYLNFLEKSDRKVRLISCIDLPIQYILCSTYTSALTNLISWNKCYSIFPRSTFIYRETVPLKPLDDCCAELHSKYSQRGWKMRAHTPFTMFHLESTKFYWKEFNSVETRERRVGDRLTWIMPLGTIGISEPSTPDFVLESAGFTVNPPSPGIPDDGMSYRTWESLHRSVFYTIHAPSFQSPALRYRYSLVGTFPGILRPHLNRSTLIQLAKLDRSKREELLQGRTPQQLIRTNSVNILEFEHPPGWDYMDNAIRENFIDED